MLTLIKLFKYYKLVLAMPQQKIDGDRNLWIVKPAYNSRGFGIHILEGTQLRDELLATKAAQISNKVVQKYIERPMLLQQPQNVKFDLRQWVLVTSFEPLQAYCFDGFYARYCSREYSLSKGHYKDNFRHLTNYSIQRKQGKKGEQFVMEDTALFEQLYPEKATQKLESARAAMHQIIVKTLRSAQESQVIDARPNCFEVYGFDFMLDNTGDPWLLEVNLSPGCVERTTWLTEMLDRKADGLFDLIEKKMGKVQDDFTTGMKNHLRAKKTQTGWKQIHQQKWPRSYLPTKQGREGPPDLTIMGRPVKV
jgi:hypothetical protein